MANVIEKILHNEPDAGSLAELMSAFKDILIHDITLKKFADVYAQKLRYGIYLPLVFKFIVSKPTYL